MPITDYNFIYFFTDRLVAVVIGVLNFYFCENFLFSRSYVNACDSVFHSRVTSTLQSGLDHFIAHCQCRSMTLNEYNKIIEQLSVLKMELEERLLSAKKAIAHEEALIEQIMSYDEVADEMIILYSQ